MTVELATLQFDETEHKYTYGDRVVPSVTQILQEMGVMKPFTGPDFYGLRGKYLHSATEMYDRGTLDDSTVDGNVRPFLNAYVSFCQQCGALISASEKMVYHRALKYAGRFDRLLTVKDRVRPLIVDLKTGSSSPSHRMQVAAYIVAEAMEEDVYDGAILYLRKDGTYKLRIIEGEELAQCRQDWVDLVNEYHSKEFSLW